MTELNKLNDLVIELAEARRSATESQQKYDEAFADWESANEQLVLRRDGDKAYASALEDELRAATAEYYKATGEKKPHPAVGIRVGKRAIYDPDEARRWAIEHADGLLTLDDKRYKKALRDGTLADMPGEVQEYVTVTISRDIDKSISRHLAASAMTDMERLAYGIDNSEGEESE